MFHSLLIFSLEDLKADQGIAVFIFSFEVRECRIGNISELLRKFMPIWSFLEINQIITDLGEF